MKEKNLALSNLKQEIMTANWEIAVMSKLLRTDDLTLKVTGDMITINDYNLQVFSARRLKALFRKHIEDLRLSVNDKKEQIKKANQDPKPLRKRNETGRFKAVDGT